MSERLMTVQDVADLLSCSRRAVYNRVHRRAIPHLKVGARVYFKRSAIDAWLEGGTTTPAAAAEAPPRQKQLAIRAHTDVLERLDFLAGRAGKRSELARDLLYKALEDFEEASGVGQTRYYVRAVIDGRETTAQYRTKAEALAVMRLDERRIVRAWRVSQCRADDGTLRVAHVRI